MELILKAIILGVVEGITEFLPISSTGHLILFGHLLGFKGSFAVLFQIVIQLGAILAVVFFYREKIGASLKHLKPSQWGFRLWALILLAFIPSALFGFLFDEAIEKKLFHPQFVSIMLIVGAILMLLVEYFVKKKEEMPIHDLSPKRALLIGFSQCMALLPGMSRSASTIMGGMLVGLSVKTAAEFSFFLAMPTMVAATGYSLIKGFGQLTRLEWFALGIGFVVSFVVAFVVVGRFLAYLGKRPLRVFSYYRLIVGFLMLLLLGLHVI